MIRGILTLAGVLAALAAAGCGGSSHQSSTRTTQAARSDVTVAADLRYLLDQGGSSYQSVGVCVHQAASQYVCQVAMTDGSTQTVQVTDDGKSIYEHGIAKN